MSLTMKKEKVTIKKSKTVVVETFTCEFCKKSFSKESTLAVHMCEKKRRWFNREEKYVRIGHNAYRMFYQLQFPGKTLPTYEKFMNSRQYIDFTKFGKYIIDLNVIRPESFIEFVIKMALPIRDWQAPHVYERYVREISKKETPIAALERNILLMEQWAQDTGEPWIDFFKKINSNLAVSWIRNGRISPWIIYTSKSANDLFIRMNDEQLSLIKEYIEPSFWKAKVKLNKEDVAWLKKELEGVGL